MTYAGGEKERVKNSLPEKSEKSPAGKHIFDVPAQRRPLAVEFDYEEYAHCLAGYNLSEEQKRAHLAALWEIMLAFAALGFGIHPAQKACGDRGNVRESLTIAELFRLECEDNRNMQELVDAPGGAAAGESE